MMKHDPYSLTELIRNDDFIAWVLHPDAESEIQWALFLENHPEKKKTVNSARDYVILLAKDTGRDVPTPSQSEKMWRLVEGSMREQAKPSGQVPELGLSRWHWVRVAASAALILSIGSASYWFYYKEITDQKPNTVTEYKVGDQSVMVQKHNNTEKPMMLLLPDGSSVVMAPGAILSFFQQTGNSRREVTLSGKAFFEIAKNKEKPFFVYSHGLATKVLGTSFSIDASERNKEIKVQVRTGVVTVFSVDKLSEKDKQHILDSPGSNGVVLTQDQVVAFSRENGRIIKLPPVTESATGTQEVSLQSFVFDETPVSEVFHKLEEAYNVSIIYDHERLEDFPLNANLTGQPFRKKIEVICSALDAEFNIVGNEVIVTSSKTRN